MASPYEHLPGWDTEAHLFRGESKASGEMQDLIDAACYANAWAVAWTAIEHELTIAHPDGTVVTAKRTITRAAGT